MKALIVAAALVAAPAFAQDSPFLKGEALDAEAKRNCEDGCVLLNPTEAAALMMQVEAMVRQREQAAFAAGVDQANKSCRNRI
ncbi:MAG TPA: hypothetical protein VD994_04670 [Prosthecobacter sp.]|nr:hypothetical protein [Prosthecobacter sp.]